MRKYECFINFITLLFFLFFCALGFLSFFIFFHAFTDNLSQLIYDPCTNFTIYASIDLMCALFLLLNALILYCCSKYSHCYYTMNSLIVIGISLFMIVLFISISLVFGCYHSWFNHNYPFFDSVTYIIIHYYISLIFMSFFALALVKIILTHILNFFGLFGCFSCSFPSLSLNSSNNNHYISL